MNIIGTEKRIKKCIIAVSQSDYLVNSAGTEKFIREVESILNEENIVMLHLFPINIKNKEYVGINTNGKYYGVCKKNDLEGCLETVAIEKGLEYIGIHLHHIKGWNKKYLINMFDKLNLPVMLFVHDVYMVCSRLSDKDGGLYRECGSYIQSPSEKLCNGCKYAEMGIMEYNEIKEMLNELSSKIVKVIFPSDVAKNNWISAYGEEYEKKMVIRPHMEFEIEKIKKKRNEKIKIAFLGVHSERKGYDTWINLVQQLDLDKYEAYCFSKRPSEQKNVHSVYVNFSDKYSKSMTDELRENNIDIVFLWSIVQETFSYTYYEAMDAGCYVITNDKSGNIAAQVFKNDNGIVFENCDECFEWFEDFTNVRKCLDKFIASGSVPCNVKVNRSSRELLFDVYDRLDSLDYINHKKGKSVLWSIFYYLFITIRLGLIKGYNFFNKYFLVILKGEMF